MKIHQIFLGAAFTCALAQLPLSAAVNVTPAVANLSADSAQTAASPSWTSLPPITIAEGNGSANRGDFSPGTNVTLILRAPTGFEFNRHVTPSITFTSGRDITAASLVMNNPNSMTVTLTIKGSAGTDAFVIGSTNALQMRPTQGTPLVSGNVYRPTSGGTAVLNGLVTTGNSTGTDGTSFASLALVAGNAQSLVFTVEPNNAVVGQPFGTQPVIRTRDQFGNNTSAGLPTSLDITTSLLAGTGSLVGTTTLNIGTEGGNGVIGYSDLQIDAAGSGKQLAVAGGSLAPATSALFNVGKGSQAITFGTLNNKTLGDLPFTVSATASSGLPVSFSVVSGPATVLGDLVTLTGTGNVIIRAEQAGNINWNEATAVEQTFEVAAPAVPPSVTITKLPGQKAVIHVNGDPSQTFRVEGSDSLDGVWEEIQTVASDSEGLVFFEDDSVSTTRFYRAVAP
ncbi:MAG: hypothetical protein ACK4UN_19870 [Limisphaerales bacterium]